MTPHDLEAEELARGRYEMPRFVLGYDDSPAAERALEGKVDLASTFEGVSDEVALEAHRDVFLGHSRRPRPHACMTSVR